jgi:hypothetical protein
MSALLVLGLPALALAAAPTVPGVDRLPADTWVLVNWHGVSAADRVSGTNPVMRLWEDPQFKAVREQLFQDLARENSSFNRAKADDVLAVLENPVVFGIVGDPLSAAGGSKVNVYGVLNKKGREAAWTRLRQDRKPRTGAVESTYAFRGVQVKKTVTTTQPAPPPDGAPSAAPKVRETFEATVGDYELFADAQELMETLVTRLQGRTAPAGASLATDATYQRALRFRSEGPLLEAFVKVPDLSRIPVPAQPQMNIGAAIQELHPERIKGLWFSAGMGAQRMVMRAALLGDTTPGSLLDLIGGNVKDFQTASVAPVTGAYGAFRIDLSALYATLMRAVKAALPPDQASAAGMLVDSVVMAQTGLRATELLSLFGGEIGTSGVGDGLLDGALPGLLMVQITRSEPLLGLLQTMTASMKQGEERIADATVLTLGVPASVAADGAAPGTTQPVHVAVAPKMLAVTADRDALQDALTRGASGAVAPAGSMAADPVYQAARRTFPADLNGISFVDIARGHWDQQFEVLRKQLAKQKAEAAERLAAAERGDGQNPPDAQQVEKLRGQVRSLERMEEATVVLTPLLRKYLKVSAGGSWKAADGIFWDSYVN